jgi:hypothetical protein
MIIIQLIENKEAYILAVAYVLPQNDFSEGTHVNKFFIKANKKMTTAKVCYTL